MVNRFTERVQQLERAYARRYSCGQTSYTFALWQAQSEMNKCEICGCEIPLARLEAGYTLCIPCSEQHTKQHRGVSIPDADGNPLLRICDKTGQERLYFGTIPDEE